MALSSTFSETRNTQLENTTTVIAGGAVISPVWLPWLQTASETAATVAPILGGMWLSVQIVSKVIDVVHKFTRRDKK